MKTIILSLLALTTFGLHAQKISKSQLETYNKKANEYTIHFDTTAQLTDKQKTILNNALNETYIETHFLNLKYDSLNKEMLILKNQISQIENKKIQLIRKELEKDQIKNFNKALREMRQVERQKEAEANRELQKSVRSVNKNTEEQED